MKPDCRKVVDQAKAGKVKGYPNLASGSPMQILGETFNQAASVKTPQVPYREPYKVASTASRSSGVISGITPNQA